MLSILQVSMALLCLVLLLGVFNLVAKNRLTLRYSLLWIALTIVMFICSLLPGPIYSLSSFFGFESPSNFILMLACFFLLAICLSLSVIVSRQSIAIKDLTQYLATQEKDLYDTMNK